MMELPNPGEGEKLAEMNAPMGPVEAEIRGGVAKIDYKEPKRRPASTNRQDFVWIEDDFPTGGKHSVNEGNAPLHWVEGEQAFSGKRALERKDKGLAQDIITEASHPLVVGQDDKMFAYIRIDPDDPPKAIMLQYFTTEWLHRANWGDEDAIPYGDKGTTKKVLMGPLPKAGEWVRLEVDAEKMGLMKGAKI